MDASPSATPVPIDYYAFETLSRSLSSSRLDHDHDPHRLRSASSSSSSSLSTSPSDPCLSKSASASASNTRLNARAPEFKPRSSVSPPSSPMISPSVSSSSLSSSSGNLVALAQQSQQADLAASFVIPRPPGPPALVHIFNSSPATSGGNTTGSIFQIHSPVDANFGLGYRPSHLQLYAGLPGFADQPQDLSLLAASDAADHSKYGLPEEIALKIINQVEFYFSDINLATTGFLFKIMIKDPEGFVPISVIASIKKIKTLTKNQSQLAAVLKNSSKLVVSEDGKKVRRLHPLSELDMEEVQSRIIIAENLPEDHCHQKLLKIFSAVGSVKSIRSCQPSVPSTSKTGKGDGVNFSDKLHAFVEYESVELTEKAVSELNEGNWRNGLKVRLLLKRSPKSVQARVRKGGQESDNNNSKEEDGFGPEPVFLHEKYLEDFMQPPIEPMGEEHNNSKDGGVKNSRSREFREVGENRGWGKGRARPSYNSNNHNRGNHVGVTPNVEQHTMAKQPSVPRMPDGTRGFSMGRGKPVAVKIA